MTGRAAHSPNEAARVPVDRAARPLTGRIRVPGSKSLTNRHLLLAALARGSTTLTHALRAEDCDRLVAALRVLGVGIRAEAERLRVEGTAGRFPSGGRVDLGDGGTPARFMLAAALCASEPVVVDGSPRLRERPMAEGLALLRDLGASVDDLGEPDHLPVRVTAPRGSAAPPAGGVLRAGVMRSSQFASALMLIAPVLNDGLLMHLAQPVTSASYLKLSAKALGSWGVDVEIDLEGEAPFIRVPGSGLAAHSPGGERTIDIEADASSAVYWMVAAATIPGSSLEFPGLPADSRQPDLALVDVLERAGAQVTRAEGDRLLRVACAGPLRGFRADASGWPDGALAACALAACAEGPSVITGLHTLTHKESDRLTALRTELGRLGVTAETTADAIRIDPSTMHTALATIETWNDHRIAMTFAIIGLSRGSVVIGDPGCVAKSYPGFWRDLAQLTGIDAEEIGS